MIIRFQDGSSKEFNNLRGTNLRHADLSGADLRYADLRYADLRYADLSNASLSHASLSHADLSGADLSGADLSNANLSGANLSGASLSGADLSGAQGVLWADCSFSNHGECGRRLLAIKINDKIIYFCGCFSGSETDLRKYIKEGDAKHKSSRRVALNFVKKAIALCLAD